MKPMLRRLDVILVVALTVGIAWCVIAGPFAGVDAMLLLELTSGLVATIWGAIVLRNLLRARRLRRALEGLSDARTIDGIPVRVVTGGGRMALVLGAFAPMIFIGDELLDILDEEERTAVLLHEDHHRSIRAPIRAAALEAWVSIVGRIELPRQVLLDRLADLEDMADLHAIGKGCSRASLAAALIKTDPGGPGLAAFSYGSERRIRALVDSERAAVAISHRLPYEWLPVAVVTAMAVACHPWGIYFPS
jgi:hypothetical protein